MSTFDVLVDFIMKCKYCHFEILVQIMKGLYIIFQITRELCEKTLNHKRVN